MHSDDLEACGKKCYSYYFGFYSEVKLLMRFEPLFESSHFCCPLVCPSVLLSAVNILVNLFNVCVKVSELASAIKRFYENSINCLCGKVLNLHLFCVIFM